jgi:hypothetical protein
VPETSRARCGGRPRLTAHWIGRAVHNDCYVLGCCQARRVAHRMESGNSVGHRAPAKYIICLLSIAGRRRGCRTLVVSKGAGVSFLRDPLRRYCRRGRPTRGDCEAVNTSAPSMVRKNQEKPAPLEPKGAAPAEPQTVSAREGAHAPMRRSLAPG